MYVLTIGIWVNAFILCVIMLMIIKVSRIVTVSNYITDKQERLAKLHAQLIAREFHDDLDQIKSDLAAMALDMSTAKFR